MIDELQSLRDAKPVVEPLDRSAFTRSRAELMAFIGSAAQDARVRRRPRRSRSGRPWIVPLGALAALGATAAGWAVATRDPAQTTSLSCGDQVVIDATSSDPVADCGAAWREASGDEPPPLVAYRDDTGGVSVRPEGAPVPAGWLRLDGGFRQDGRLVELRASLEDVGEGMASGCLDYGRARFVTERELARLGFTGWEVTPEHGLADGVGTCATPVVQPERFRVLLAARIPAPEVGDEIAPVRAMAQRLHNRLRDTCLPLDRAADAARQEATTLVDQGLPAGAYTVSTIPVPGASCTSVVVTSGGAIRFTLRGPSGSS